MNNPLRSPLFLFNGLTLVLQPGLRRYAILPLLINALVFLGLLFWGTGMVNEWVQQILPELPQWLSWLEWGLWALSMAALLMGLYLTSIITANLIASPFNSLLAEAILHRQRPQSPSPPPSGGWRQMFRTFGNELLTGLRHEMAKLWYFLTRALPLGVLFLIPGVNLAAPFLWLLFAAWMMALEYLDYPAGQDRVGFPELRRLARQQPLHILGFGLASMALTLVPVLNFVAIPVSVAGATKLWLDRFDGSDSREPGARVKRP